MITTEAEAELHLSGFESPQLTLKNKTGITTYNTPMFLLYKGHGLWGNISQLACMLRKVEYSICMGKVTKNMGVFHETPVN